MNLVESAASHRAMGRGAVALAALLLAGCRSEQDEAAIPIGPTDAELVVVTKTLEAALIESPVRAVVSSEKDDGATRWSHRFEELVDPPENDVSKRRFRVTLANRSDKARTIRVEIDYLTPGTRALLRKRDLRLVVVPPFTEKAVSGFTQFRADRRVMAELRAVEVEPE